MWEHDSRPADVIGADGKEIAAFPTTKEITGLYQNGDRVITRGQDGVRLWDARGSPIASLPKGSVFVPSYHDAPYIYSWGPDDDVFRLLDRDGLELAAFHGHDGRPVLSGFSSDRRRVVTTSVDGTARIWEITPSRVPVLRGHRHPVREAWFLAGGSRILTRSWQGYTRTTTTGQAGPARIFETSGQPVALLVHAEVPERDLGSDRRGITDPHLPSHAHVDGKGERILTISVASYTARLWDAAGRPLSGFEDTRAYAGEFLADGRILLHVKTDTGTGAEIWDRSGRKQTKLGAWKPKGWVQFRPRSSRQAHRFVIMPTEETKTAQLLDRDGRRIRALEHAGHVTRIGGDNAYPRCWFLPRGDRFALITNDDATHILTLFDRDGKKLREAERYEGPAGLTVSADTDRFATWLEEGTEIDLWDRDGKRVAVLKHDDPINEVVLLEGGERLLAFSESATTATFWNIADGARVAVVENVPRAPTKIAIMPGSENVLPVLGLLTVPVWGRDGTVFGELQGHTRTVTDVACSPDGRWIVTASADGTARVWDAGGELHHTLRGHGGAVRTVAFAPDGTGILTTSDDGTARVWPVDFAEVKRLAEEAAFRNFTASERVRYADLLGK